MRHHNRREFLAMAVAGSSLAGASCSWPQNTDRASAARKSRLFFVSGGKTGLINGDGTGLRYLEFNIPNQATWQACGFFSDGQGVLFLSMEPRRDGAGRPFEEYYTQTPTHIWIYDLKSGVLEEIATRNRLAVFSTPQLLLSDQRLLVQVVRNKIGQIFSVNLDGTEAREFTRADDGFPYGLSLSPDRNRVAYHLAAGSGYQIWTSDLEGGNRSRVAASPGHIYFGPVWSRDGHWL